MNVLSNYDILYEINNYTKKFFLNNNFKCYRKIYCLNLTCLEEKHVKINGFLTSLDENLNYIFSKLLDKYGELKIGYLKTDFFSDWDFFPTYLRKVTKIKCCEISEDILGKKILRNLCAFEFDYFLHGGEKVFKEIKNIKHISVMQVQDVVNNDDLKYLKSAETIYIGTNHESKKITDEGFKYLIGTKNLHLEGYMYLTGEGFKLLKGIQNIRFENCFMVNFVDTKHFKYLNCADKIIIGNIKLRVKDLNIYKYLDKPKVNITFYYLYTILECSRMSVHKFIRE